MGHMEIMKGKSSRRAILGGLLGGAVVAATQKVATAAEAAVSLIAGGRTRVVYNGSRHNGFPGLCRRRDGIFVGVWRQGSSHTARDGRLVRQFYYDTSGRPGSAVYLFGARYRGLDVRDPSLTLLNDGRIALTFFVYDPRVRRVTGSYVAFSTNGGVSFGTPIRMSIDKIVSAALVELPNGELVCPMYNRHAYLQASKNGGRTWFTRSTILNTRSTRGDLCEEPTLTRISNDRIVAMIRTSGRQRLYRVSSADGGITWSRPVPLWISDSRVPMIQLGPQRYVAFYRSTYDDTKLYAVFSDDSFASYRSGGYVVQNTTGRSTYCAPLSISTRTMVMLSSDENRRRTQGVIRWQRVMYNGP